MFAQVLRALDLYRYIGLRFTGADPAVMCVWSSSFPDAVGAMWTKSIHRVAQVYLRNPQKRTAPGSRTGSADEIDHGSRAPIQNLTALPTKRSTAVKDRREPIPWAFASVILPPPVAAPEADAGDDFATFALPPKRLSMP